MDPIRFDPAEYWKLKAHIAEHNARLSQVELTIARSLEGLRAQMRASGLDPAKNYALDDASCSASEKA